MVAPPSHAAGWKGASVSAFSFLMHFVAEHHNPTEAKRLKGTTLLSGLLALQLQVRFGIFYP